MKRKVWKEEERRWRKEEERRWRKENENVRKEEGLGEERAKEKVLVVVLKKIGKKEKKKG